MIHFEEKLDEVETVDLNCTDIDHDLFVGKIIVEICRLDFGEQLQLIHSCATMHIQP